MEKEKTLKVSLEKARKWYFGNNEALKDIALQVFTKEELLPSLKELEDKSVTSFISYSFNFREDIILAGLLSIIAEIFNDGWARTIYNKGYFIKDFNDPRNRVGVHSGVKYPGIVYFKNEEDASKAVEIVNNVLKS